MPSFSKGTKLFLLIFRPKKSAAKGALVLLERIERKHGLIKYFSKNIVDTSHQSYVKHPLYKLLMQRVFMLMQGYGGANDSNLLKNDPILNEVLNGQPGSQPIISRLENIKGHQIFDFFRILA